MENSRKHERRQPMELWEVFETATGRRVGRLIDVTREGLLLLCEREIQPRIDFHLRIEIGDETIGETIEVSAKSRWCKETENGLFHVGFQIFQAAPPDLAAIEHMIDHFSIGR